MSTVPPLSLLDEPVRLALVAACEALAAAPGALYPLVYVAPLRAADALRRAAGDAAQAFGVALLEWTGEVAEPGTPALLICAAQDAAQARRWAASRRGVQVIAWGTTPARKLPAGLRAAVAQPQDLTIDPRAHADSGGSGAWLGASVERAIGERSAAGSPLVVVCPQEEVGLRAVEVQMHLDAGGLVPCEVSVHDAARFVAGADDGLVVALPAAADGDGIAELAASCRAGGALLVIVAGPAAWDALGRDPAWARKVGPSIVVCTAPDVPADPAFAALPWPKIPEVWVGGQDCAAGEALVVPDGASLLEGLGHMEVRARPGRLVAWAHDRVAVIEVDQRAAGAVVVGARIEGVAAAADRETLLASLDAVRRWPRLRLAVLEASPMRRAVAIEEPVQRVGFYFSRLDDERSRSGDPVAEDGGGVGVHAVAKALVGLGLPDAARALLRRAERESGWGVEEEILLGYLVAESDPHEAITRLRHAAVRLANSEGGDGDAWILQTDATLNALLLLVRTRQVRASDAWMSVEAWLEKAGTVWVSSPRHAAVLFELAARSGRASEARRFADLFRTLAGPLDPLARALDPALATVLGEGGR